MSATEQLERILYVLAVASRADGATYDELSRALGVEQKTIVKDLNEAVSGVYNHPAGSVEPFEITIGARRVKVIANGDFKRPVRLNHREALALGLGLRVLASDAEAAERDRILALADRLEQELTTPVLALQPLSVRDEGVAYDAEVDVAVGEDSLRGVFADAIEQSNVCVIQYIKPFAAPAERRIAPSRLLYGKGHWYVAAHDVDVNEDRIFRLDRILSADVTDEVYHADRVAEARTFYVADEQHEVEARVRYSGQIAKWIAEQQGAQLEADGSVVITHRVADVTWLVRHVLQYGGEAVVETPALRRVVADAARRLSA